MISRFVALFAVVLLATGCAAPYKGTTFEWPNKDRKVVMMPADIELSELNAGGLKVPNAEWTKMAEEYFSQSLEERMGSVNANLIKADDAIEQPDSLVQLAKLNEVVGATIVLHGQGGGVYKLPTTPAETLGPGVNHIKKQYGADYALFVKIHDSYASGGRAAAMIVAAAFGVGLQGGSQYAFATLVDLETGKVVWHNGFLRNRGNMKDLKGARETTQALLKGFPE